MSYPGAARRGASVSPSRAGADRTLPRASRLRARKLYLDLYERGLRIPSAYFVLFGVRGVSSRSRLGITATKKYGHAAARNRIKRVIREIFRHHRGDESHPVDLVVNVKASARTQSFKRLESDLAPRLREMIERLFP